MILTAPKKFLCGTGLSILVLTIAFSGCAAIPRGVPATGGILNFGQVNNELFRGAQPTESGMVRLRQLGVRTLINLRSTAEVWPAEEALAGRLGLGYVSVPLRGLSAPTDAQVAQILALIESSPPPVFIHCEHGADRTGTIVACYRMQHDGWTVERALTEAKFHGFSIFQIGMRGYIRRFPARAQSWAPSGKGSPAR